MTRKVPYLYEEQIERDAAAPLAEYAEARGRAECGQSQAVASPCRRFDAAHCRTG
jgi:hypothetical protein